jgi:hypothetical protein
MNMMTTAFVAIATITVIATTIAAAINAAARMGVDRPTTRAIPATVSTRARRQATRGARVSRPIRLIRPQYLPALARARILRLQTSHLAVATPRRHQVRCK